MVESARNVVRADTFVQINIIARVRQTQLRHGVQAVAAHIELGTHLVLLGFGPDGFVNFPQRESVLAVFLPVEESPGLAVRGSQDQLPQTLHSADLPPELGGHVLLGGLGGAPGDTVLQGLTITNTELVQALANFPFP